MISTAQLAALEAAAAAADGRPELRCHVAMIDIYHAAGLLPPLEIAQGPRDWARASDASLIEPGVEECGLFVRVDGAPQPADLLGFRLGRILHHVAISLSGGRMVHVFGGHGVKIAPCIPDAWAKRLERVWRPRSVL